MKILEFEGLVEDFFMDLADVEEETAALDPGPGKWSLKEIVGHLIDSASNNHQRFVRLQFARELEFPAYDAEPWVKTQLYKECPWSELISLWYGLNLHLLHLVRVMPPASFSNRWKKDDGSVTLEELIEDYYRHLEHHFGHFEERLGEVQDQ
jgi:hypothetical protein